ncbi:MULTISPECIES: ArsR/SmtB family transcription factor [Bizionia]|uniref:Helix-turn-helix transcriptional regulator n=1 Tax=Bizionia algoritergicola TaxID=291187 RepID=A0A5D0QXD4_9FLAO|nr:MULTISPECIES: metalloregulator ArsR/SmtB family transcription factor [Bizionia]OBX23373.1 transcriptional regulator [Bizionia sp. APA-3]TYB73366.1 helix-turn-helix transcriptional regulator [Bizionia algoritergicola]UPS91263.1 metalloregulator ArsR/SmtB family transcription factor [Bizionia sp. M204]
MKLEITCTRAEANHKQLQNCMETLDEMEGSFQKMTKLLSIAGSDVRLKILYLLNLENELCPCDLADILKMSMPAISQHIRKIKDAGIINSRRDGQTLYYSLNRDETEIFSSIFKSIELIRKTA